MRRDSRDLTSTFRVWLLILLSFYALSVSMRSSSREVRVVELKIAAPVEFKISDMWRVEIHKMVRDVSQSFNSRFGIAFSVKEVAFWQPGSSFECLPDFLRDLIKKVPRGACHLVIGIIPSRISQAPPFGIADYLRAYVLIKDHPSKSGLAEVLTHELCHIFGAIDLEEKGSIMDLSRRGGRYDAFTAKIVALNKNRSFGLNEFPLPPDAIEEAIALYRNRLGQEKEKNEIQIVLSHLHQEKSRGALMDR